MGKVNWSFIDHDAEASSVGMGIPDLGVGNIAAQLTLVDAVETALLAVTIGELQSKSVIATTEDFAVTPPADGYSQRETKWLVSGVDTEGNNASMEIPCANLDLLPSGSGVLDLSAGAGLALKSALDDVWTSRQGNLVTVARVIHVGRNI